MKIHSILDSWSKKTVLFLIIVLSFFVVKKKPSNILAWDVYGHYMYLPATFINHDPFIKDFGIVEQKMKEYKNSPMFYQGWDTENGGKLIRYPMGYAVLMSPFFFAGHIACSFTDYPKDGFSQPYQWSIVFGCLFYVILGLFFFRKLLLIWFDEKMTSILMLLLAFGTNYFFMITIGQGMSHGVLFAFYCMLIYFTHKWHQTPNRKYSILLGLTLGLMCLTRASEILALLIPLLWNITDKISFKKKIAFLKNNKKSFFTIITIFILCGLPQLIFMRIGTGHWIIDSYHNPGEGIDLHNPHLINFLFSFRKGWLLYTPLMIFALLGFLFMPKKTVGFYSILVFVIINTYFLSSWTVWWYAESFGQRSIVQSYPVYVIGLGFLLQKISKPMISKLAIGLMSLFIIGFNQFQGWQTSVGIIHGSRMTSKAYKSVFLKTKQPEDFENMLLRTDAQDPYFYINQKDKYKKKLLRTFDYENTSKDDFPGLVNIHNNNALLINEERIYSKDVSIPYYQLSPEAYCILEVGCSFYFEEDPALVNASLAIIFRHNGEMYNQRYMEIKDMTKGEDGWYQGSLTFIAPYVRHPEDDLQLFGWQRGKGHFYLDNIEVYVYERINHNFQN